MSRGTRQRPGHASEAGLTLVELLVASAMGVVLRRGDRLDGGQRDAQPAELSKRAQNVSSARWVLERMTREIRNGIAVDEARPPRRSPS